MRNNFIVVTSHANPKMCETVTKARYIHQIFIIVISNRQLPEVRCQNIRQIFLYSDKNTRDGRSYDTVKNTLELHHLNKGS